MTAPEPSQIARRIRDWCSGAAFAALAALTTAAAGATDQAPLGGADDAASGPGRSATPSTAATRVTPWLDEVRAQRRAWEERRKAAHEAFEARHRATDPWGAAQHDAWEDEVDRRREARRQQMEQDREHFRALAPPAPPVPPWPEPLGPQQPFSRPPTPQPTPSELGSGEDSRPQLGESPSGGVIYPPGAPPKAPYSPQDWDNLWYYRGY